MSKNEKEINFTLVEGQNIEVEFNKEMVIEDIQAQEENNIELLEQDNFNEDSIEEMNDSSTEIEVLE